MIDLIFDTETTGFVLFKESHTDTKQPHVVQLAARLVENDTLHNAFQTIVSGPVECSEGAAKVHGITEERRRRVGVPPSVALNMFLSLVNKADRLVAHNLNFDLKAVRAMCYREGIADYSRLETMPHLCTMLELTPVMKLPGKRGFKWPKLIEAYCQLVDPAGFEGAHDAMADVIACEKVLRAWEKLEE